MSSSSKADSKSSLEGVRLKVDFHSVQNIARANFPTVFGALKCNQVENYWIVTIQRLRAQHFASNENPPLEEVLCIFLIKPIQKLNPTEVLFP